MEIGYWLSSEEQGPRTLVENAKRAEAAGFSFATAPDTEVVRIYREAGGTGPIYGKLAGAFTQSESAARKLAKERQPNAAIGGDVSTTLPRDFAAVVELVREDDLDGTLVLGDDPASWRDHLEQFERAGFTHVALHHVGEEQSEFIEFARQLL